MLKYLILFLLSFIVSLLITPVVRFVSKKLGAFDLPGERKVHNKPIPRLGGFSIFVTFILILIITSEIDFFFFPGNFFREINLPWLLVGCTIIFGLGTIDDLRRIPPASNSYSRSSLV